MIIERMKKTNPGETICLSYEECEELLKLIEEQEERIAIMSEGGWHKATELPKETSDYIVTIIEMERWQSVTTRCYSLSSGWGLFSNEKLVCWMPFPEPPNDSEQEAQRDYEQSVEYAQYCERYEPTYNPEDGSM